MNYDNDATFKRRELLTVIARMAFAGTLVEQIDRVPIDRFPKNQTSQRCCIHQSRAIVRQRLLAILGYSIETEDDEITALSVSAQKALNRQEVAGPILTFADEACSSCVRTNYFITNACRGCLARPCQLNCPKKAITMVNGQACIDAEKCVNCGICQKACPYHAIIFRPIPCEEACPVGAIAKNEHGKEQIDYDKCIHCGKCARECPFGAIMEKSQIVDVIRHLRQGDRVAALIAPAIAGQFPGTLENLAGALQALGFDSVIEVARGAEQTARDEADEFTERMAHGAPFMTTSCCPAYTQAVKKHLPGLADKVSSTPTPMHTTARLARQTDRTARRVFIGPCIAKRQEALENPDIDYVLTFEELGTLFVSQGIDVAQCAPLPFTPPAGPAGRRFPLSGGVTRSLQEAIDPSLAWQPVLIDGLSKKEIRLLRSYANGSVPGNFIEVMACAGGCAAGPGVISPIRLSAPKIKACAGDA